MKLVICLLVIFHHSQSLVYSPTIQTDDGKLQGTIEDSIIGNKFIAFKGIPYATPPVGERRFLDPLAAGSWKGILNASQYSDFCPQLDDSTGQYAGNEDCLYLNVYTPSDFDPSNSAPKSVMFWIHGGSFDHGSSSDEFFGPDYLVAKDVIVVTVNYRLGVLGFLNLEDRYATGNQGLKDQVLALQWVQKNIAYFGGNPNSVTIFGASAGAASAHYIALSSMANGLYHKVIAQSGTAINPWAYLPYSPKIHAEELVAELGIYTNDSKKIVEFLRKIHATNIVEADYKLFEKTKADGLVRFVPSVDIKSVNPFFPTRVNITAHRGVKVPFLLGYVTGEGMGFLGMMNEEKWNLYDSDLGKGLSPGILNMLNNKKISVQQIREYYFGDKKISAATAENYARMQSDLQFIYGIHDTIRIQVCKHIPTYMYRFSYDRGISYIKDINELNITGVPHSEDLNFIFYSKFLSNMGYPAPAPGSRARLVVDRVTRMWTDFAKTGNPTPANTQRGARKWMPVQDLDTYDVMDISNKLEMIKIENINNRIFK